ncbi:BTAD domain-containing putative transcriptional regulator [Jannaschia sp. R86511]|uniref:nSTAND1 domain-containing NTPase n=1 Tax=Jannaschia sp. R86511 TaxID=3093853 RepID=UPI0036D3629E
MSLRLLGPVMLDPTEPSEASLTPRHRLVLTALAVRRGHVVPPGEIAEAVWAGVPPPSWSKQVQICVVRLRKALGHDAIETAQGGYRLVAEVLGLDVDAFEQLVRRGRELARDGQPDRAATTLARAVAVWGGDPFTLLGGWPPAVAESARLRELHAGAQEDLLECRLAVGEHREVAAQAEVLVAQEPLRERRWALLALARYRCGRQAEALGSLQRARRLLRDELGIDPGEELVRLETSILHQDPTLRPVPRPRVVSQDCPYKGLSHHDVGDPLFGRDADVASCLARLRTSPLVVVAGPSGCGKSSLVRAGVVPALVRTGRDVVVVVPGLDGTFTIPVSGTSAPVLVVDQLEEAVAGTSPPADTLARLAAYALDVAPVVVTVRADRLAALTADTAFSRLAERGLYLLPPLDGDALREVVERPAVDAGLRVEPGLVELLVRDVEGQPGALPLLSHALVETWQRRDGSVLTIEGYRASGGIRGAVARSADRLFDGLSPHRRATLRWLLLRLVVPSPDGDPVRCRVAMRSLRGDADLEVVLGLLVRARLLTVEDDSVQMSHESLARAWPRLRAWLEEEGAGRRTLRHLTVAAEGWESLGRPVTELYRGGRLETALDYCESAGPVLTAVETQFLTASREHAGSERRALEGRVLEESRRARRLRVLLVSMAALLVVALVSGALAVAQAREARDQRDVAREALDEAALEGLVAAARELRGSERDVAALLAVEAVRRWPDDARTRSALLGVFTTDPGFLGHRYLPGARWVTGDVVPGSVTAVVSVDGGPPALLDLDGGGLDARFGRSSVGAGTTARIRVSRDGSRVVTLAVPDPADPCDLPAGALAGCASITVHDVGSGRRVMGPTVVPFTAGDVAIDDDGSRVAVAGGEAGDVVVHRTSDGALVGRLAGVPQPVGDDRWIRSSAAVAFGPDGLLRVGSLAEVLRVVDPVTLQVVRSVDVPARSTNQHLVVLTDEVVGAGNNGLVAVDEDGVRWARDLRETHPDPCPAFAVSAEAGALWCGNNYGQVQQHDLLTGAPTSVELDPQLGRVGSLAVTADGRELVSFGGEAPVVSRWRLDGSGPVTSLTAEGYALADGYDTDHGSTLVVAARDTVTTSAAQFADYALWDPVADREVDALDEVSEAGIEGVGWAGRDTLVGMRAQQQQFAWFDVDSSRVVAGERIGPECDHVWASADGDRAYCGLLDGQVWTIDATTRRRGGPAIDAGGAASSVSATAGGRRVVVTARTQDGSVTTVHDGRTGALLVGPMTGADITSVSLDGVLVGATGGEVTRYDLGTLEPLQDLPGARGEVSSLQFSDDSSVLIAASHDQTVSVYDVPSGRRLGDPVLSSAPLSFSAYLRPDGKALAVTDEHGVAVWDLDPAHQLEAACRLAGRNLTGTEWTTHLGSLGPVRPTCPELPAP